ncbi:MAG TPA: Lsr2 family protein [Jatrophihabitantaceae bacterium]|jgi:hypothetical protein|nr:Lsr2 family protein [Jatrophihabitantaceae bacterium]
MAKTTVVTVTDDLDGSPNATTVTFGFGGASYEIDLARKNAGALERALKPYIASARRVRGSSGRRGRSGQSRDLGAVRTWAKRNGHKVSERGRIASSVLEAYDAAN